MKTRMIASFLVIALVASVIGGASMAYFTAKTDAPAAEFTAGTVMIKADAKFDVETQFTNVNPGDCYCVGWNITNTGSKAIRVRAVGAGNWTFNWTWVWDNKDALCYSDEPWQSMQEMMADSMFNAGKMGDPANPVIVWPCPYSAYNWTVVLVDAQGNPTTHYPDVAAFHMYYDGVVGPGDTIQLCLCVFFSGPRMTNIFQAATFTLGGQIQAVQASNNAPFLVWGDLWMSGITDPRLGEIDFSKCKDQAGELAPCCQERPA